MEKNDRLRWIDIAKGIAIILVVLGHVITSFYNSGLLNNSKLFELVYSFIYSFHMPLFFFISGFLAYKKAESYTKESIVVKLLSYAIPYIVFSVLLWLFHYGFHLVASSSVNNVYSIEDLLLIPIYPLTFMWFIYALMCVVIVEMLLTRVIGNGKKRLATAVICGFALNLFLSLLKKAPIQISQKFWSLGIIDATEYYCWFILGKYVSMLSKKIEILGNNSCIKNTNFLGMVLLIFLCGSIYLKTIIEMSAIVDILYSYFVTTIGISTVFLFAKGTEKASTLEQLGKYSMPIYLLHGYFISAVRIIISKVGIPLFNGFVPLVLCGQIGVVLPYVLYLVVRKSKIIDFCFYPKKYLMRK